MSFPTIALSEIARPVTRPVLVTPGTSYRTIGVKWWGGGAYERETIDGTQTAAKTLSLVHEGDLIINKIWVRHGSTAIASKLVDGCAASNEFPTFELDHTRVLPHWIHWLTKSRDFWSKCDGLSHGTSGKNRIKPELFLTIQIPFPPVSEQHRIVAQIEELAAKIKEARELRREAVEEAARFMGSVVSDCFEKGAENGWTVGQLGDYVIHDCYGTSEKTTDDDSGIPILRMGNIQNGRIDSSDLKYLQLSEREKTKLLLTYGDILVNRTNSAELVGKCAVFDLGGEYGFASYLIRLRLDTARAEPKLIAAYINSPAGRTYMFNERKQMTGQANVNATKLKALPMTLPSLSEQHRIVAYFDSLQSKVDSLKQLQAKTSAELDALLPSILDKAFKGEL